MSQRPAEAPDCADSPFSGLPRNSLSRLAGAGATAVDCIHELHARGSNLVVDILRGCGDFTEWEHYPPEDRHDPSSHAQYYFHAHPREDREAPDYGHFHTLDEPSRRISR